MNKITLVQLRAIIGDEEFNKLMTPIGIEKLLEDNNIKFKDFIDVDNKLANSYDVQKAFYVALRFLEVENVIDVSEGIVKMNSRLQQNINEFHFNNFMDKYKSVLVKNNDGTYDADGDIRISVTKISKLPVKFRKVDGNFECSNNRLMSLEGSPREVNGSFVCSGNGLTSLMFAPENVRDGFYCNNNRLTSLEGSPKHLYSTFNCSHNELTNLNGVPEYVGGGFYCKYNNLTSLEGAPKEIGYSFDCSNNKLTSLKGAPEKIGSGFDCERNQNLPEEEIEAYRAKLKLNKESYSRFSGFYFKG